MHNRSSYELENKGLLLAPCSLTSVVALAILKIKSHENRKTFLRIGEEGEKKWQPGETVCS